MKESKENEPKDCLFSGTLTGVIQNKNICVKIIGCDNIQTHISSDKRVNVVDDDSIDDDDDVNKNDDDEKNFKDVEGQPKFKGGVGFLNPGNKCFFNSVFIVLSHIRMLTDAIHAQCTSNVEFNGNIEEFQLVKCFNDLIKKVWSNEYAKLSTKSIRDKLRDIISADHQEDCMYVYLVMIDILDRMLKNILSDNMSPMIDETGSTVRNMFGFNDVMIYDCQVCHKTKTKYQPQICHMLNVPEDTLLTKKSVTLNELMENYYRKTCLFGSNKVECSKCARKTDQVSTTTFSHFPTILVIEINKDLLMKCVKKINLKLSFHIEIGK